MQLLQNTAFLLPTGNTYQTYHQHPGVDQKLGGFAVVERLLLIENEVFRK